MLFLLSCHIWIINSAIFDLIWSSFLFRILHNYFILTQVSSIYFILNFFSIFSFIFLATILASFAYQYFKNGPLSFTTPAPVNVNENNCQIEEMILLIISSNISLSHSHSLSIYMDAITLRNSALIPYDTIALRNTAITTNNHVYSSIVEYFYGNK